MEAPPLRLRGDLDHVDALHLDVEQLLDSLADLRLVRVRVHAERVRAARRPLVALLADDRSEDDLARIHYCALPCTSGSAVSETSSERAQTTAATSSSLGATMATFSRLRKLLTRFSSPSVATTTSGVLRPEASTKPLA